MSERMTMIEEHADTVRDFVLEQDEPSDFALDALARIEKEAAQKDAVIKALADALEEARTQALSFCHAEACVVEDEYDTDDLEGCKCVLQMVPGMTEALRLAGRL